MHTENQVSCGNVQTNFAGTRQEDVCRAWPQACPADTADFFAKGDYPDTDRSDCDRHSKRP